MASIVRVPALGAAIANVTILEWVIPEGGAITAGERMLDVETDKMAMEIPAERGGILHRIIAQSGMTTEEGKPLAVVGDAGDSDEAVATLAAQAFAELGLEAPVPLDAVSGVEQAVAVSVTEIAANGRLRASPVARRYARERGIDLATVAGSGRQGLITKDDVLDHHARRRSASSPAVAPAGTAPQERVAASAAAAADDDVEVIPYTGARRVLGERLAESYRTAPHFTMFYDISCERLIAQRTALAGPFERETGVRLSYLPFIIKAIAVAVQAVPIVNATLAGDEIRVRRTANVGVAVAVDDLIVVPVLRQPATRSITEIGRELARLSELARRRALTPADSSDATITVSNVGNTDIASALAIINPPEVAIIAVTKIVDRVVPIDGGIGVRPMMSTSYTYDHRVVQGVPGARFAERVKALLESPEQLLA